MLPRFAGAKIYINCDEQNIFYRKCGMGCCRLRSLFVYSHLVKLKQIWIMEVKKYIQENAERFLKELESLIEIPSISAKAEHKADIAACA